MEEDDIIPKMLTYTISHFRVKIYSLLHKVADGKLTIDLTMSRPHQLRNTDMVIIRKDQYDKLLRENRQLKER